MDGYVAVTCNLMTLTVICVQKLLRLVISLYAHKLTNHRNCSTFTQRPSLILEFVAVSNWYMHANTCIYCYVLCAVLSSFKCIWFIYSISNGWRLIQFNRIKCFLNREFNEMANICDPNHQIGRPFRIYGKFIANCVWVPAVKSIFVFFWFNE